MQDFLKAMRCLLHYLNTTAAGPPSLPPTHMVEYADSENGLRGRGPGTARLHRAHLRKPLSLFDYLLEQTIVYSSWQAPFASAKLELLLTNNSIARARRVLDVGCGP